MQCTQAERFVLRSPRAADRGLRVQKRPPSDRCKNLASIHGRVPGACADKTHKSCRVLGGLRERARPFRRVLRRFGPASVGSAQRSIYRVWRHGGYLEGPAKHNLQSFRCPQTVPYFPAPTSAPGTLWTTKPPPAGPNCLPGSLTCPLYTVLEVDGRLGDLGLR